MDDLLHLGNFGKVLTTLSVLSRSPLVLTGVSAALQLVGADAEQTNEHGDEYAQNGK